MKMSYPIKFGFVVDRQELQLNLLCFMSIVLKEYDDEDSGSIRCWKVLE